MPKSKILLVDYDPRSIKQCKEVLIKNFDCQVEVALDGIAALNLFPQAKPDLVIVEAMLPKKHGFEVCHEIKKSAQGKNIPVIIVTHVYKGRKYRHQAFHIYCCDEYLEKPISDQFLIETVKKFLPSAKEAKPLTEKKKISVESKQDVKEESAKSEAKAVAPEVKVTESKEKVSIHDEKATIVAKELEQEISSKVDEILTLFSENLTHPSSKESDTAQEQEAIEAEVETEVKEKPKKKTRPQKSKKRKKKKPEPALAAVAKEEAHGQAPESSSFLSEGKGKIEVEEEVIESAIPESDEEIAEEEEKTQEQEEEQIQEEITEEAQTPEQEIEEAIETKLCAIEKLDAPQEEEPKEDLQEVKDEDTPYEEAIKEEETKEEALVAEETERMDEGEKEADVKELLEEVPHEIPEEVLASAPPRKSFFKSRTFFIVFSAIIVLGIIFLLFPFFKGKKEDSTPVQAGASIPSSLVEKGKVTDTELESSKSDSTGSSLVQEQKKSAASEEPGTSEGSKPISTSKQSKAASQMSTPTVKPKPKQTIKQDPKKTTPAKASPVIDKKQEEARKPAPSPKKISETPLKKPVPEKTVTPLPPKAVPSSAKQDSTDLTEKAAPKKDPVPSPKQTTAQKAAGAVEEQKIAQSQETPQEVPQDLQKQKELVEDAPEQAPQPEESPLPKIGQLLDSSLLDRDPPYLAHDPPKYPVLARLKGIEGQVVLKVLIKETGYVEEVTLVKGLDESIDEAAIKAVYKWVYRPPTSQGIRVKTWKTETLTFPPE